ncbi:BgTH12-06527 [Blumeria graminis f. sp. triticale]|uniref:BgTH12-06527 n=1 Tax=Blumeria graminis f. sp. triticale TaxID=1689686 RepID=A0A9W4D2N1_BLUGR|nr:BgTH12-06527 [Blumeria graminis f. sp. triticale]
MATNGSSVQPDHYKNTNEQHPANSSATETHSEKPSATNVRKDEVGWYFVEKYYNTLSRNPEKLHLFHGQFSQYVSGLEAVVSPVSVGRSAIQERIREHGFQDCKVRITNVDSQASYDNIVIQVIGETSSMSAEPRKFVQTFVLAQQPTGYFVLNDIFRYIVEEVEEEPTPIAQEKIEENVPEPVKDECELQANISADEIPVAPADVDVVEQKLEPVVPDLGEDQSKIVNGTSAIVLDDLPKTTILEEVPVPDVEEKLVEEEVKPLEVMQEDPPTPPATQIQPVSKSIAPVQPSGPPKPLSWASRAAAAVGSNLKPSAPAVPSTTVPKSAVTSQVRAASSTTRPLPTPSSSSTTQNDREKESTLPPTGTGSGWQTAGENPKKQNRPQSISAPLEKEGTMGYVRNVTEKVNTEELRAALSSFGNLIYFDINRYKNCAFVEFATTEGYQAAASASPHQVSGEPIYVEPRRPKANAYGGSGNGYPSGRGGANQRGRGGFPNRGRGPGAPRGRGQASNA